MFRTTAHTGDMEGSWEGSLEEKKWKLFATLELIETNEWDKLLSGDTPARLATRLTRGP